MKHAVRSWSKRVAAVVLAAALAIPTAYASAGTRWLTTTQTLTDGLTYVNTITQHSSAGRVESYAFQLSPDSNAYPIMVQSSGTAYGAATINKAISYAESLGYNVIGGINSDFFGNGGVPLGVSIENGVYKSSPESNNAVASVNGQVSLSVSPQVYITLKNQRDGSTTELTHFNKWRNSSGGLYLYNDDFSTISTQTNAAAGWMVRFKVVDNGQSTDLTVNSTLTLEVVEAFQTSDSQPIGEGYYILTAANESGRWDVYNSFQPGDQVTLTTSCSDSVLSKAQWASGAGDIIVRNGAITDSSQWVYGKDGRNPRTALGVKADGTLVLYEVDGRQSGYSSGLSERDLADELLQQGCQWAVNLDGGGSSILSARLPGSSSVSIQNSPSGGSARSCATFILLVTDSASGPATRLALKDDGLVVLSGSSVTLGDVVSVNDGARTVDSRVSDAQFTSGSGLGSFNGSVYTAGGTGGTDTIQIYSPSLGLSGTAQVHVVTALSQLHITKSGSSSSLSSLTMEAGDSIQLSATGTYWSREALRSGTAISVTWSVSGGVGTITQDGLFTANGNSGSGTITVRAGGVTTSIPVSLSSVHTDVTPDHWAYTAVEYCYEHDIVSGVSATEFGRDYPISRGDFVLMLYGALGRPAVSGQAAFTDVASTDYYAKAITWASANGLVSGVSATEFGPRTAITREQAFTILHNAMPLLNISSPTPDLSILNQFSDQDLIADYAKPHMAALVAQGVASGAGDTINPRGNLTRAEMAALLYKLLTYNEEEQPVQPEEPAIDPNATLTLDPVQGQLGSAQTLRLQAVLTGAEGTLSWRSSDPTIAAVSSDGTVTNVYTGSGTAQVTITASLGTLSASATITCQSAERVGQVTAEPSLNVRSGPGTNYSIVSSLAYGRWVVILDDSTPGWYQVLFSNGSGQAITGYVSGEYLSAS